MLTLSLLSWEVWLLSAQIASCAVIEGWAEIDRILIEVVSELREMDITGQKSIGLVTHRRIGFSRNEELYYFSGHDENAAGEYWLREPYNLETVISKSRMLTHRHFLRAYEMEEFPEDTDLPRSIGNDAIMFVLPYWLPARQRSPGDHPRHINFIVEEAMKSQFYESLSELRTIGGLNCVGFSNREGTDVFWIAPENRNLVLEREWYSNDQKSVGYRLSTLHYREFSAGVWLPSEFEVAFTDDSWKSTRSIRKTRVIDVQVNEQFQQFDDGLREGAIRLTLSEHRRIKDFVQTHPGGIDLLEEVASLIRFKTKQPASSLSTTLMNVLNLAAAPVICALMGWTIGELFRKGHFGVKVLQAFRLIWQ